MNNHGQSSNSSIPDKKPLCPRCRSPKQVRKAGFRRTKKGPVQRYKCTECKRYFTLKTLPNTSYSPRIILTTISTYNMGFSGEQTRRIINKRFKIQIPISTLYSWINIYDGICTFLPLRRKYTIDPKEIIQSKRFHHQQVYEFKYHKLKLNIAGKQFPHLKTYLTSLISNNGFNNVMFWEGPRCSNFPGRLNLPDQRIKEIKNNNATKIVKFGLELANSNYERHQAIEDFFLINDSATIATEVPVHLTPTEANSVGITIPRTLTGHIDIIQVRNNKVRIMDYKPDREGNAVNQLQLYAMCLKKRMGISNITCAYFDNNNYHQFTPIF
jgi:transposase-like protein